MGTGIGVGIAGQVYDLKPGGSTPPPSYSNLYAMQFVPASSQSLVGSATPLLGTSGTGAWSISIWFYLENLPSISRNIIDINQGGSERFQMFFKNNDEINVSGAWTHSVPKASFAFAADQWYNVIYMYDGNAATPSNVRFALNGSNYFQASNKTWNQTDQTGSTTIGANNGGTSRFWDGYIDEVSIYDKYLTDAECVELYNGGTPTDLSAASFSANLQHWWRMGDPTGTGLYPTIPDAQGSINMTMTNMVASNIQTTYVP